MEKNNHPTATFSGKGENDEILNLREIVGRLRRGGRLIIALIFIGATVAMVVDLLDSPFSTETTSTRIVFSYPGFAADEYPDHSKFQIDDIRSGRYLADALARQHLKLSAKETEDIATGFLIEPVIPPEIAAQRERLRNSNVAMQPYSPDEFVLSINLPRSFPLSSNQRRQLLLDIIDGYKINFQQTYADTPPTFGAAFDVLAGQDISSYEYVLNKEFQTMIDFLDTRSKDAPTFRSRSTGLTFGDLARRTHVFEETRLFSILSRIRKLGYTSDPETVLGQIQYHISVYKERLLDATNEENVVNILLAKAQEREQSYVLGIRSQATQQKQDTTTVDKGLIDSLLANDSYNLLIRRSLDIGIHQRQMQSQVDILNQRYTWVADAAKAPGSDHEREINAVKEDLRGIESLYLKFVSDIRNEETDYAQQKFADAVKITNYPVSESLYRRIVLICAIGAALGGMLGAGLSILDVPVGKGR